MILGVMSDTHGNRALMAQVADSMIRDYGVDRIVHLGDDYDDGELLTAIYPEVWAVPGLWCPAYRDGRVPNRLVKPIDGVCVVAAHTEKDLRAGDDGRLHLLLTGHTHTARIAWSPPVLRVNPGHLKRPVDRGERASFAIVRIEAHCLEAAIYETDGTLRTRFGIDRLKQA